MKTLLQDLRFARRLLLRSPGFSLLVVLTLALGIGANLAIFSVVDAVVLSPLPYEQPDRLVSIWEAKVSEGLEHERIAPPNFGDYRTLKAAFEDAAAWWHPDVNLADAAGDPIRVTTVEATANFFSVLGVRPRLGPGFELPAGRLHDEKLAVVISDRLWKERYGGDPQILGKSLRLNGDLNTVVGVMAAGFHFPGETDVWQRLHWDFSERTRYAHFMEAVGRLRPGVSREKAQAELAALSERLGKENPPSNQDWRARLVSLHTEIAGAYGPALSVLMGAVGLLLLLACANVANLLLARASARQREVAIRAALGAARGRLLRQLFTESLVLGACGAVLGLALAWVAVRLLVTARPVDIPGLAEISFDGRVAGFGLAVALLTVLLFGAVPALQLSRADLHSTLKEAGRGSSAGPAARRTPSLLVVVEVALAMMLLVGAGLLIRSVVRLLQEEPGFVPERVLTATLVLPASLYPDWPRVSRFYSDLKERLDAHPGIAAAGAASFLPLEPAWVVGYSVPDRPPQTASEDLRAQYVTASAGYFETLRIPLLAGRTFDRRDTADSPAVLVINREMARRTWPNGEAVGKIITSGTPSFGPLGHSLKKGMNYQVIGVVGDVKNKAMENDPEPALYFVQTQFPYRNLSLVVRGQGAPELLAAAVREELKSLDAGLPLADVRTLDEILAASTARPRFVMALLSGFALLALVLAAIGIYGVLSYDVSERRQEIGVRLSLGASPGTVQRLVLGKGMLLAGLGLVLGTLAAFALCRLMASLLFGVSATDRLTFAAAVVVILAISLAACYLPARRASKVDPIEALRAG
jgi:putative ABC transport system permease protein